MNEKREKLIIIGSGPAAHSAAIYAARAELQPLIFEGFMAGGVAAGGQLTTTTDVENYAGFHQGIQGPQLMVYMRKQSVRCGARVVTQTIERVDLSQQPFAVTTEEGEGYHASALIIATGATAKRLHIAGEDTYWQHGISACAVCDGALPLFRDKPLMVIGGGDAACEEALFLTKYGSIVYMVVRRDQLRASAVMQTRVRSNPKVQILWSHIPVEATGKELLTHVRLQSTIDQTPRQIEVAGLFYAIGHTPNTVFLQGQLQVDDTHYVITEPGSTRTSVAGVFAAGDVQDKIYRQAVTSAGTGCMAALDAEKYLSTLPAPPAA